MDDDKKHTPEGNTLSEASISSVNASLPWKWCTGHESREIQLRQVILIFIDNMITGVLLIISPLQISHQLSLVISYDKHGALVTLQIKPRVTYNPADCQATPSVRPQLQKAYLFSKLEVTQPLHNVLWHLCFLQSVADVIYIGKGFDNVCPKKQCLVAEYEVANRQDRIQKDHEGYRIKKLRTFRDISLNWKPGQS